VCPLNRSAHFRSEYLLISVYSFMGRTLLIGHPGVSWREWLKGNRKDRDLVVLDPSDADGAPPGRLVLLRGGKATQSRFYGSLDSNRAPHVLIAALAELLASAGEDALIQLPAHRPSPVGHQLLLMLAALAKPEHILMAEGTRAPCDAFPVGPEEVVLEKAFPPMVRAAQRKAHWLKMLEACRPHQVDLAKVCIEGTRLGSGQRLQRMDLMRSGLEDAVWAELTGASLFIISDEEPDETKISRALDDFHVSRVQFASPDAYNGLLCSFVRGNGEDFGYGVIERIDFESGIAHIKNSAEEPAPVRILRIGSLKIDASGSEHGEARPWQV